MSGSTPLPRLAWAGISTLRDGSGISGGDSRGAVFRDLRQDGACLPRPTPRSPRRRSTRVLASMFTKTRHAARRSRPSTWGGRAVDSTAFPRHASSAGTRRGDLPRRSRPSRIPRTRVTARPSATPRIVHPGTPSSASPRRRRLRTRLWSESEPPCRRRWSESCAKRRRAPRADPGRSEPVSGRAPGRPWT